MNDKPTWKDNIPSEGGSDYASGKVVRDGFSLTDDEIDGALRRLQMAVQDEQVPEVWMQESGAFRIAQELDLAAVNDANPVKSFAHDTDSLATPANKRQRGSAIRKRWGRIATGVAAAAVLVGLFATPLGTKAIADAMQTLYVQNLVGVGQDDLSQIENAFSNGSSGGISNIDLKQFGSVEINGQSRVSTGMTLDQATRQIGFPVKVLPEYDPKKDHVYYTPSVDLTFRLKVDAINGMITHLGGKSLLPAAVNEQAIVVHVPAQVSEQVSGENGMYMGLNEMSIPTVQVPSDVDLNQVRQALLDLPFLPGDIRQSLSMSQNWQDTLYVPVNGKATNLTINGYPAVLAADSHGLNMSILWLEDGVLYQLSGSTNSFPTADSLVAQAKELAQ